MESSFFRYCSFESYSERPSFMLFALGRQKSGYTADEALGVLQELHDLGFTPTFFEQPVMRDDWSGLGRVSRIARSRAIQCASSSRRVLHNTSWGGGYQKSLNVKLAKMGLMDALEVVDLVRKEGLGLMIGGMVDTRLEMGFAAHRSFDL
ncbi:unnamed protein product [Calypogeia fissa]